MDLDLERLLLQLARERGLLTDSQLESLEDALRDGETLAGSHWGPRLDRLLHMGWIQESDLEALFQEINKEVAEAVSPTVTREAWRTVARKSRPSARRSASLLSGEILAPEEELAAEGWDRYELLGLLGEGGMGRVYKARDHRLNRILALKFIKGHHPEAIERLLQEAQTQARIEHPNIARIYEVGEVEGRPYIAMQYIQGRPIDELGEKLSLEAKLGLVATVAEAVHAAHRQGLVHRDLKPENILVVREEDGSFVPFVLDFGLACEVDDHHLTTAGTIMGTPHYMSPEQARGDVDRVDRRSDVWSLGVTLYQLVSGHVPYDGQSGMDVLMKVLQEEPPSLRKIIPTLPRDLETLIHTCLQKDPERRYASARALAEDLHRYLEGEPIAARAVGPWERMQRWARRNRSLALTAALGLLSLLVLGSWSLWSLSRQRTQSLAALRYSLDLRDMETALRATVMLPAHDVRPEWKLFRSRLEELEKNILQQGGFILGPGHGALGRGYLALGDLTRALDHLEKSRKTGYRSPEQSYAYGMALIRSNLNARSDLGRSGADPDLAGSIEHLRTTALRELQSAQQARMESRSLLEGYLHLAENQPDKALLKAQEAMRDKPWLYEARLLEGESLMDQGRKAIGEGKRPEAARLFTQAWEALEKGSRIAPSEPILMSVLARCGENLLEIALRGALDLPSTETQVFEAVNRSVALHSERPGSYRSLATLHRMLGTALQETGKDPRDHFRAALCALEKGQSYLREGTSLGIQRMDINTRWGVFEQDQGRDPSPFWKEALLLGEKMLATKPKHAHLLDQMAITLGKQIEWNQSKGQNIENSLNQAIGFARQAVELRSQVSFYRNTYAYLLDAKAKWEAQRGGDPTPWWVQMREQYEMAQKLGATPEILQFNLAISWIEQARWGLLQRGQDPSKYLQSGLACLERAAHDAGRERLRARAALIHAQHASWTGRGTEPWFIQAQEHLHQAQILSPASTWNHSLALEMDLQRASDRWRSGYKPLLQDLRKKMTSSRANDYEQELQRVNLELLALEISEWKEAAAFKAAQEAMQRAWAFHPAEDQEADLTQARLSLAQARHHPAEANQAFKQARKALESALRRNPEDPWAFLFLSLLEDLQGRSKERDQALAQSLRRNPLLQRKAEYLLRN